MVAQALRRAAAAPPPCARVLCVLPLRPRAPPGAAAMSGTTNVPRCFCDCGEPAAGRVGLGTRPPGDGRWALCICTLCGPVPTREGVSRGCAVEVDPIVVAFTGGLVLCEDCRESCARRRRSEAGQTPRGNKGVKRAPDTAEDQGAGRSTSARTTSCRCLRCSHDPR